MEGELEQRGDQHASEDSVSRSANASSNTGGLKMSSSFGSVSVLFILRLLFSAKNGHSRESRNLHQLAINRSF
jgi:hypothetical protein